MLKNYKELTKILHTVNFNDGNYNTRVIIEKNLDSKKKQLVNVESLEVLVEFSDNGDFAIYDVKETVNDRKHSIMLNGEQEYITDIQINDLTNSGIAEDGLECYEITLKMASFIGDCDVRISLIQL